MAGGVLAPNKQLCCENQLITYRGFTRDLTSKTPDRRVLAILDDFDQIGDAAMEDAPRPGGIAELLSIWSESNKPTDQLLWMFAGHGILPGFRATAPAARALWCRLRTLSIDFLDQQVIRETVTGPLRGSNALVPDETASPTMIRMQESRVSSHATASKQRMITLRPTWPPHLDETHSLIGRGYLA